MLSQSRSDSDVSWLDVIRVCFLRKDKGNGIHVSSRALVEFYLQTI